MGTACYTNGDQGCADESFTRARQLAPRDPDYAWQAAINDVVSHQPQAAIAQLKDFLQLQPEGLTQSFQLLTRGFEDPELVWRDLLGSADLPSRMKFLGFLAASGHVEAANGLWQDLASQKKPVSLPEVAPLVNRLIEANHYAEAASVWSYARESGSNTAGNELSEPNLIFNGNFEQKPLNAGFDWRHAQQSFVELQLCRSGRQRWQPRLRVDFTVPQNSEYDLVYQFVPVAPNRSYDLSALVKSQGITSDSGPKLRVIDPACMALSGRLNAGSNGYVGLAPCVDPLYHWADDRLVRVSLWRPRSRTYPTEITGQLWLDNVSLLPASHAGAQP